MSCKHTKRCVMVYHPNWWWGEISGSKHMNNHIKRLPLGTIKEVFSTIYVILGASACNGHDQTIADLCRTGVIMVQCIAMQHKIYRHDVTFFPKQWHGWAISFIRCVMLDGGGTDRRLRALHTWGPQPTNIFTVTMCLASTPTFVFCWTTPGVRSCFFVENKWLETEIECHYVPLMCSASLST